MTFSFIFSSYNVSGSGKLSLEELKMMMEKLGAPQTHLGLKAMIQVSCHPNFYIIFLTIIIKKNNNQIINHL